MDAISRMSEYGVHRWIVEALGDSTAAAEVGGDGYLKAALWHEAVERVRLTKFGALSAWDGTVAVATFVAREFLGSRHGRFMREVLAVMPLPRVFESVVLPMAERMRRRSEFSFRPTEDGGGEIDIRHTVALSPATMLGFFRGIVEVVPGHHTVHLAREETDSMVLEIHPEAG